MNNRALFDPDCRRCKRLAEFLDQVHVDYPAYHARPVGPFGDDHARLLIVGLAPGMHGANATGRPFTGDFAGILLYETLHEFGLSNQPQAVARDDGLRLYGCRITNAVKCLPPQNKPLPEEVVNCNIYLSCEIATLPRGAVILALGQIAHTAVLRAIGAKVRNFPFKHGLHHALPDGNQLLSSYHCSRYNTQTGRLTRDMFRDVIRRAAELMP